MAGIVLTMRRFLVLFMLCLLPVQISWATVADYCGHGQDQAVQHFGHHDDKHHQALPGIADDSAPGQDNSGHDHCHLSSVLGVLSVYTLSICKPVQSSLRCSHQLFPSPAADQPDRPNWRVPA